MHRLSILLIATFAVLSIAAPAGANTVSGSTKEATGVTTTAATLNGVVQPQVDEGAATYHFEYGPTSAYGARTAATAAAPANKAVQVHEAVAGLTPSTLYHYRLVVQVDSDSAYGKERTFTTSAAPATTDPSDPGSTGGSLDDPIGDVTPDPGSSLGTDGSPVSEPVLGQSVDAGPRSGSVSVKVPGTSQYVALGGNAAIPTGSIVDARRGSVRLVTAVGNSGATQAASFGGAIFKVVQKPGAGGLTDLVLRGGNFAACRPTTGSAKTVSAAGRHSTVRRLWGRDHHGRFRTHGRSAIATVRGTVWAMTDRCDGTLTTVKRGAVSVRDLRRHKTVLLHAHERYIARRGR